LLEDNEFDAELIARELKKSGMEFCLAQIQSEAELRHELAAHTPDLILSDHGLPSFSGFKALEIVRQTCPWLPFVFVSGSNDQQMVVDMFEQGATDYVFKKEIQELAAAVHRALEQQLEKRHLLPTRLLHPELELGLPAATVQPPSYSPSPHRLLFCPRCQRARDETGNLIPMEKYFATYAEVSVVRQLCAECS